MGADAHFGAGHHLWGGTAHTQSCLLPYFKSTHKDAHRHTQTFLSSVIPNPANNPSHSPTSSDEDWGSKVEHL